MEGLYSGLGSGAALSSTQLDVKMKLLVEAPAAVEDALASLLDHHDATLQVGTFAHKTPFALKVASSSRSLQRRTSSCGVDELCSTK